MENVNKVYVRLITALLPLMFFPLVLDGFGFGKMLIFGVLVILGLVMWIVAKVVKNHVFKIYWTPVLFMTFLWVIWTIVTYLYMPLGVKMRTIVSTNGLGYMLILVGMMFLWTQNNEDNENEIQVNWLTFSGMVVAVVSLIVFLIPVFRLPILIPKDNPILVIDRNWSLMGNVLSELILLVFLVILWFKRIITALKNKENYIFISLILSVLVLVSFLDVFRIFKNGWSFLDWTNAWIIAVESLKQKPIIGVGIGNFVEAFYWWRSTNFNMTPNWLTVYGTSGNYLTQIWTETGLVGLIIFLVLVWQTVKSQNNKINKMLVLVIGVLVMLLPFFWTTVLIWLWFVTVLDNNKRKSSELLIRVGEFGYNIAPVFLMLIVIGGFFWTSFWLRKIILSEIYYRNSLVSASKNDGFETYNWQIKAIAINENVPEYRRSYSQTNLALALTLLQNKDITEVDKQKAVTLIQQAIREGKATVGLDTLNPNYWINLAMIYKQLVGIIDGSADWSAQAYSQAGMLDVISPSQKLDFGGLLYSMGNYEQADRVFEQAVTLKNNLANSWYNWAYTGQQLNRLNDAVSRLTQAVALVPTGTADYDKASKELGLWKNEIDQLKTVSKSETQVEPVSTLEVTPTIVP